jgi:hypothetical protein
MKLDEISIEDIYKRARLRHCGRQRCRRLHHLIGVGFMAARHKTIDPARRIYDSITKLGDTLVRMAHAGYGGCQADLLFKLEFFNRQQRQGPHRCDDRRVGTRAESTRERRCWSSHGGSTGTLAFVAAPRLSSVLVMPESMSLERRKMLTLLGARLLADRGSQGHEGRARAAENFALTPVDHAPTIPRTPIRRFIAATEIWSDTQGGVDAVIPASARAELSPASASAEGAQAIGENDRGRTGDGPVLTLTAGATQIRVSAPASAEFSTVP